jgi:hypothetical protein
MTTVEAIRGIPEQGQLVEVRGQRFAVTDIRVSTSPFSSVLGQPDTVQHLVSLASVEDDALGEELQVVWELEPGASLFEARALPYPDGFDPPDRLDAFLDAVRWGASSSADTPQCTVPLPQRH